MLKFFAEKMWVAFAVQKLLTFFQQKISEYCILNLLKQLTKWFLTSSLSQRRFEQLDPVWYGDLLWELNSYKLNGFFQIPFVYNIYTNVLCNVRYFVHVIQIKHSLNQIQYQQTVPNETVRKRRQIWTFTNCICSKAAIFQDKDTF